MSPNQILIFASIAQVTLTFVVGFLLFTRRVGELKRRRINPQKIATSVQSSTVMEDLRASDNFKHLFEIPVIFYFLCAVVVATNSATITLAILSWIFVVLRYVHSYIQCSKNNVMARFYVFVSSSVILMVMWAIFVFNQLGKL